MMPLKCDRFVCFMGREIWLLKERLGLGGQSLCVLCGQFVARGITTPLTIQS